MLGCLPGGICFLGFLLTIVRSQAFHDFRDLRAGHGPASPVDFDFRSGALFDESNESREDSSPDDDEPPRNLNREGPRTKGNYELYHNKFQNEEQNHFKNIPHNREFRHNFQRESNEDFDRTGQSFAHASAIANTNAGGNSYGPRYPQKPGYPGSRTNSAQASAVAQANNGGSSYGPGLSPYRPGYNPLSNPKTFYRGSSSAQAEAQAKSNGGNSNRPGSFPSSPGYSPFPNQGYPDSGLSFAKALAEVETQKDEVPFSANFNPPFNHAYPGRSNSAQASSEAKESNGGESSYKSDTVSYSPGYYPAFSQQYPGGSGSVQLPADAQSGGDRLFGPSFIPYKPEYSSSLNPEFSESGSLSQALANAQATNSEIYYPPYSPGYGPEYTGFSSPQAQSLGTYKGNESPFSSVSQAQANAVAREFNVRRIPQSEYIKPHNIGAGDLIRCQREGELHNLWSSSFECFVCACVRDYGVLKPVCASCSGCMGPLPEPITVLPPIPPLPPITSPPPVPPLPPVPVTPTQQASCDPLPTNQPFQNPLNPCQTCICKQTFSTYGMPDIQITCEENLECVLPPDVTPLPPVPMPPVPIPLPECERFPQNVEFPHPSDPCKLCKCTVEPSPFGVPEQHILCFPILGCHVGPEPFPVPTPEPVPLPDIVTQTPVPWPPIIIPEPPQPQPPGPLPGPPPHESCLPYPPNVAFQHPWDDCKVCMCSETAGPGIINVEVNCYTKKSCCVELPFPEPEPLPSETGTYIHPICELKSFGYEFVHPEDKCRRCMCQLYGNVVAPVCSLVSTPGCAARPATVPNRQVVYIEPKCRNHAPNQPFVVDCNECVCQAVFNYVLASCTRLSNCGVYPGLEGNSYSSALAHALTSQSNVLVPSVNSPYQTELSQSQASAEAQSLSGSSSFPDFSGNKYPQDSVSPGFLEGPANLLNPGYYPGQHESSGGPVNLLNPGFNYPDPYRSPAEAQVSTGGSGYPSPPGKTYPPEPGNLFNPGFNYPASYASSSEAQALAGSYLSPEGLYPVGSLSPGVVEGPANLFSPGQYGSSGGSSNLFNPGFDYPGPYGSSAEAQVLAGYSEYPSSPVGSYSAGNLSPNFVAGPASLSNPLFNYPGSYASSAEAQALAESSFSNLPGGKYPGESLSLGYPEQIHQPVYPDAYYPQYGQNSAVSVAEASAAAESGFNNQGGYFEPQVGYPLQDYPYALPGQSSAYAEGNAQTSQLLSSGSNSYPYSPGSTGADGIPVSVLYPSLYPALNSPHVTPLYQPGINGWDSPPQAQAQAQAVAQGGSNAQSHAQASAVSGGRSLIKSGEPEEGDDENES